MWESFVTIGLSKTANNIKIAAQRTSLISHRDGADGVECLWWRVGFVVPAKSDFTKVLQCYIFAISGPIICIEDRIEERNAHVREMRLILDRLPTALRDGDIAKSALQWMGEFLKLAKPEAVPVFAKRIIRTLSQAGLGTLFTLHRMPEWFDSESMRDRWLIGRTLFYLNNGILPDMKLQSDIQMRIYMIRKATECLTPGQLDPDTSHKT